MSGNKTLPMESVASGALAAEQQKAGDGLEFPRHFTKEGATPYDEIEWDIRSVSITNEKERFFFIRKEWKYPKTGLRPRQI